MKQDGKQNQFTRIFRLLGSCLRPVVSENSGDETSNPDFQKSQKQSKHDSKQDSVSTWANAVDHIDISVHKESEGTIHHGTVPGTTTIVIPDMFRSFMAVKPTINPRYERVKEKSGAWFLEKLNGDPKACRRISKTDFAFFAAIAAPDAGEDELLTLCDWGNWVFPFDDLFDNGTLKDDPVMAQHVMTELLAGMEPQTCESAPELSRNPLLEIHNDIWLRISQRASNDVQERFKHAMNGYCKGVVEHVDHISISKTPSLTEYMAARRRGVGVEPVIALVEFAQKIEIPMDVYHHNSLRELRHILTDMILIQNDVLSYCKEQSEGVAHNIITVLCANGMTIQQAFDYTGELLKEGYRDWYLSQARLSQWSEEVDNEVQRYISSLRSIMQASLHWHFNSDRYFGSKKDEVRKHRTITVLADAHGAGR